MTLPACVLALLEYSSLDYSGHGMREVRDKVWAAEDVLDGFLAVESESKERTQKAFDLRRRGGINNPLLDILRTKVRALGREGIGQARSERDDDL